MSDIRGAGISASHFCFRITMAFLWMDAPSSLHADCNAEPCTFWWLRSCFIFRCSSVQASPFGGLYWINSRSRASMVQVKVGIFELEAPYIAGAVGMRPKKPERLFITTGRVTTDKVTLTALCLECFMSLNDTENKRSSAACSLESSKLRMHYVEVCIRVRSFFLCTNTFSKYGSNTYEPPRKWSCITFAVSAHGNRQRELFHLPMICSRGKDQNTTLLRLKR